MRRKLASAVVGLVAVVALVACSSGGDTEPEPTAQRSDPVEVSRVTDGDTFVVEVDGREEKVRLIGINSPEDGECFAAEATVALADLIEGESVRLERDITDRDQFDRLLRHVFVGDVWVNEELVRNGFAQAYRYEPDITRADALDQAQAEARREEAGLWAPDACGEGDPIDAAVEISGIEADPPGDDTLDPNAELVEVHNRGADAIDLTGWGVKDETAGHRFAFPTGFSLTGDGVVRIHTGCGDDTATDLFWCNTGSAIWNNDGDTAFLLDPDGNIVDTRSY